VLEVLEREHAASAVETDVPARVQSRERRARTDENGTFLFTNLGREVVRVRAVPAEGTAVESELVPRADGSFADLCLALPHAQTAVVAAQVPR
jgi:hypothetical protein